MSAKAALLHIARIARSFLGSEPPAVATHQQMPLSGEARDILRSMDLLRGTILDLEVENQTLHADYERAAKERKLLFSSVSHDLRTPLHAMQGLVSMLQEERLTPEQGELVRMLESGTGTMLALINDLLDLGKIEAGELKPEFEFFSAVEEIQACTDLIRNNISATDVELVVQVAQDSSPFVLSDRIMFGRILANLVSNALKFTHEGTVTIRWDSKKRYDVLSVSDTGIGISDDNLERIFEAFAQSRTQTHSDYGGTGLGLSICKQLTALLNGEISVQSQVGRGSTFSVRFPHLPQGVRSATVDFTALSKIRVGLCLAESRVLQVFKKTLGQLGISFGDVPELEGELEGAWDIVVVDCHVFSDYRGTVNSRTLLYVDPLSDASPPSELLRRADEVYVGLVRKKLLALILQRTMKRLGAAPKAEALPPKVAVVVDDSLEALKVAEHYLKSTSLRVKTFRNSVEAMAFIKSKHADVGIVLTDMRMPHLGGAELIEGVRKWEVEACVQAVPMLIMSGTTDPEELKPALSAGATDILCKPVALNDLLEKITLHLGGREAAMLKVGEVSSGSKRAD